MTPAERDEVRRIAMHQGRFWPLDVEMARQMGAAYMAAADAAEES